METTELYRGLISPELFMLSLYLIVGLVAYVVWRIVCRKRKK